MEVKDLVFLKDLQKRLKEGNHVSTAFPRHWGLKDYKWVPIHPEGYSPTNATGATKQVIWDPEGVCEYEVPEFLEYMEDELIPNCVADSDSLDDLECFYQILSESTELDHNAFECAMEILDVPLELLEVEEVQYSVEGPIFLSLEEAMSHIKQNHYHYTSKVHPYGYHGWRSGDYEQLMRIVFESDFEDQQGCDYCNKEIDLPDEGRSFPSVGAFISKGLLVVLSDSATPEDFPIKYCPMCGKKLENTTTN